MRIVITLILLISISSCSTGKNLNLTDVNKIEIKNIKTDKFIQMNKSDEYKFLNELNQAKETGPYKFMKEYLIIVHRNSNITDSIYSNGFLHIYKGFYKSNENIIEKYLSSKSLSKIDTVQGQIETAMKLNKLMHNKNYEEAIELFSKEQQKSINIFKQNKVLFENWCKAWTLDKNSLDRYIEKIEQGKAIFIYEEDQWKIDER